MNFETLRAGIAALFGRHQPLHWNGKVIVIGAGASGLYAAYLLHQHGVDVTILEASAQSGGRIRTLHDFADYPIELGAEYVNGKNHILHHLAREANIPLHPRHKQDYLKVGDSLLTETQAEHHPLMRDVEQLLARVASYNGEESSLADYLQSLGASPEVTELSRIVGVESGGSNEEVSVRAIAKILKHALKLESDEAARPAVSYLALFEGIQHALAGRIHYQKAVTAIHYDSSPIRLSTNDGTQFEADKVIITVPLAVLQRNMIQFDPALPPSKQRAIENLRVGPGMKVILKFRQRFWPDDLQTLAGGRMATYWSPLGSDHSTTPTLTAFAVGEHARRLCEGTTSPTDLILEELNHYFGENTASANFVESYVINWSQEPYIGGYVTVPTTSTYFEEKAVLAQPVANKLFFAGEATNTDPNTIGYVHGAIQTGEKAAQALLKT